MTITITTGNKNVTDVLAYLDDFDENFTSSGRGVFSNGLGGDYGSAESEITETADTDAQAYVMRDDINYSLATHTLTGSISSIDFGYGATATEQKDSSSLLELAQLDYTIAFSPAVSEEDDAHDVIYGMLGSGEEGVGRTDKLVELMKGDDILFLGAGGDDVFSGYRHDDTLKGRSGDDTLKGRGGADTLKGNAGDDTLIGGNGADALIGGKGADTLIGGKGADTLKGNAGDDTLAGGKGADTLLGGIGKDVLNGGMGKDVLTGGIGRDSFVFTGNFGKDTVTDFTAGKDTLDLSGLTGEAASFGDFLAAATERDGSVVYDLGGDGKNVITLLDTSLDDLGASDFLF